jgi:AcrR family transcriptional regulator
MVDGEASEEGRGSLPAVDRERPRVVAAFARAAAENGYRGLSLERVARIAGLSPEAVRAEFPTLEAGLLAAQEAFLGRLLREATDACEGPGEWPPRVRRAVASVIGSIVETHALARAFSVEAGAIGLGASARWFATLDGFADLLAGGRRHSPRASELPASAERVIIGGVASIVADRLLAEDPGSLAALEPDLVELILLPYLGAPEARRIARG